MFNDKALVEASEDPFCSFQLEDFENPEFCSTYLAHHKAEVVRSEPGYERSLHDAWTLFWPFGFMCALPGHRPKRWAEYWGCIFIRLWRYEKWDVGDADEEASRLAWEAIKKAESESPQTEG